MEMRTCKKCNIEKELNDENFKKSDGVYYDWKCRNCKNEERREKRRGKKGIPSTEYKPNINKNGEEAGEYKIIKPEIKINRMDIFNDSEIEILKQIIQDYTTTKNKNIEFEKGDRERKTYNIEKELSKRILQEARKKGITASDILNIAVRKYFFNV